jgi:DNA-binding NarL/FixJ family response regulator
MELERFMNILYVEDHATFAGTVKQQFLSRHTVTVVPSLSAARQAMLGNTFDLLLVDYDLEDGKGDTLIRELAGSEYRAIAIGVSSHEAGNAALLRAGAAAVCSKSEFDRIQTVIETVVKCEI